MGSEGMTRTATLEVRRGDLADARIAEAPLSEPADGQALLRVERFGLTANVITYAVAGDTIGYWRFFPAGEDGWGRIPAWGFAEVVASAGDALAEGDRLFGYLPMATHVLLTPEARGPDVLDVTPHRAELPRAYNVYRRAGRSAAADARTLVLRPLFMLCFLLADQLEAEDRSGAEQVLVSSASSKTALGLAYELGSSGARVTGLTSARNLEFVRATGIYDEVATYDAVGSLDPAVATVTVDMAGDGALRRAIHEQFGDALRRSILVGATHASVASFAPDPGLPGPAPAFFFAPDRLRERAREWGADVFEARVERAFAAFSAWSEGWLGLEQVAGEDAVLGAYGRVLRGEVRPDTAIVAALSAARAA
jgi:hypothetical protein